jgi:ADP-ribose pyrophosphatase YjhB (NUDIX family)
MSFPVTPLVGCDTFVADEAGRVLLIRRADNGFWALPGGAVDLNETPAECAQRECLEETGLRVRITRLFGVFSSLRYAEVNYPFKGRVYCHVLFQGEPFGGTSLSKTAETTALEWFAEHELPPLSDGHEPRIRIGFAMLRDPHAPPYFE